MKTYKMTINGEKYEAKIIEFDSTHAKVRVNDNDFFVELEEDNQSTPVLSRGEKAIPEVPPVRSTGDRITSGEVKAPIPGVISSIPIKEGDTIRRGMPVVILEAMKMESEIAAPFDGVISKIHVREKAPVQEGDVLVTIKGTGVEEAPVVKPVVSEAKSAPKQEVKAAPQQAAVSAGGAVVKAPIPGLVLDVKIKVGDMLQANDVVVILEAMKMESEIATHVAGKVTAILVTKGQNVQEGQALIELGA